MTWYASHIYAESKQAVLSTVSLHPLFSKGLYLVKTIDEHRWPASENRHELPKGGLLVMREVCDPEMDDNRYNTQFEARWHLNVGNPVLPWTDLVGPAYIDVIQPPNLPVLAFGKLYLDDSPSAYPPVAFLRFLKHLSDTTNAVISFYHHRTGAERAVDQEFAWIFGKGDFVYVRHVSSEGVIVQYSRDGISEKSTAIHDSVLKFTLRHYGLNLPTTYFALHTRRFDWSTYKMG